MMAIMAFQVNQKYPEGIDQAEGCVSAPMLIKKENVAEVNHNKLLVRRREMAAEFGFIDTKEVAMKKQKEIYLLNKKHAKQMEEHALERENSDKNARRDKKMRQREELKRFSDNVGVGGGNAAAAAVSATANNATFSVKSLIGCKAGQSISDKLREGSSRKGLRFS